MNYSISSGCYWYSKSIRLQYDKFRQCSVYIRVYLLLYKCWQSCEESGQYVTLHHRRTGKQLCLMDQPFWLYLKTTFNSIHYEKKNKKEMRYKMIMVIRVAFFQLHAIKYLQQCINYKTLLMTYKMPFKLATCVVSVNLTV